MHGPLANAARAMAAAAEVDPALPPLLESAGQLDALVAQVRPESVTGTNAGTKFRRLNRVPGVITVPHHPDILLTFDFHQLTHLLVQRHGRVGLYGRVVRIFLEHVDETAYRIANVPDPDNPRPAELGWWDERTVAEVRDMKARFADASLRTYGGHAATMAERYGARDAPEDGGAGVLAVPRLVHASLGHGRVENICFNLIEPGRKVNVELPLVVRGGEAAAGVQAGQYLHKLRWNVPVTTQDVYTYPPPAEGLVVDGSDMRGANDRGENAVITLNDVNERYLPEGWKIHSKLQAKRHLAQPVVRVAGRKRVAGS